MANYKEKSKLQRATCEHYNNGFCNISLKPNGKRRNCALLKSQYCYKDNPPPKKQTPLEKIINDPKPTINLPVGDIKDDIDRLKLIIDHLEHKLKLEHIL